SESPLKAASLLDLRVGGKPIQGKAAPAPVEPANLVQLQGQRAQAAMKLAEDFGFKGDSAFLKDLGRLLSGDVQAAEGLSGTKRDDTVRARAREALGFAEKYGRSGDAEFKKALARFVVENLKAAEKLKKGSATEISDEAVTLVMDKPPRGGPPAGGGPPPPTKSPVP